VVAYISGRLLFHSQGYHWIREEVRHPSDYLPNYPRDTQVADNQVPIIIGNHVTYLDVFYINYKYASSFVAKKEEQSVWAFRTAGKALDSIWVERGNDLQKNAVLQAIQQRVEDYKGHNQQRFH